MDNDAPTAAAGWYPTPDGNQRYWDGERWLDIPAPTSTTQSAVDADRPRARSKRGPLLAAAIVAVCVLILGGAAVAWKIVGDQQAAAAQAERAASEQAAAEAHQTAKEKAAERADDAERNLRAEMVPEIEASIKTMAAEHIADELIDGPILSVDCSPVGGGSTDDLTETTTVFECFVANEENADGTFRGYYYNATMNWNTGSYTYGYGQP